MRRSTLALTVVALCALAAPSSTLYGADSLNPIPMETIIQPGYQPGSDAKKDERGLWMEMSEAEADGKTLQCVFADNGAATIAAQQLSFATGTDIELVVRRLRKPRPTVEGQPGAEGLEDAVVLFDFSVSARAAIQ